MESPLTPKELALMSAQAAYDAKAENIRIFDVRGHSSITDYCILCTATSIPHLRAVMRDLDGFIFEKTETHASYKDNNPDSLWGVLDYIDIMVHVQTESSREFYELDKLWANTNEIDWTPENTNPNA